MNLKVIHSTFAGYTEWSFHDQKQKPNESMDACVKDLHTLIYHIYPQDQKRTQDRKMAYTMVPNQFAIAVELRQEIKINVVGAEGTFEQLLAIAKAKCEELGN